MGTGTFLSAQNQNVFFKQEEGIACAGETGAGNAFSAKDRHRSAGRFWNLVILPLDFSGAAMIK